MGAVLGHTDVDNCSYSKVRISGEAVSILSSDFGWTADRTVVLFRGFFLAPNSHQHSIVRFHRLVNRFIKLVNFLNRISFGSSSQGYIERQALYACITCTPDAVKDEKKRAGICVGCSMECHDGHELIELYTKRNFRCDCGTSKILAVRCKLAPLLREDNDKNTYNQNFGGVYCICKRPYPDPEDDIEDEMIQCIICEDWYHSRHLESAGPASTEFEEMVCAGCVKQNEFLHCYSHLSVTAVAPTKISKSDEKDTVDIVTTPNNAEKTNKIESTSNEQKTEQAKASPKKCDNESKEEEATATGTHAAYISGV